MTTVFAKLNLKDHKQIVVLDSPSSFESELAALEGVQIIRDLKKAEQVTFSLAFVATQEQVSALAPAIARKADGDAIVWFAYPKGARKNTSRRSTGMYSGVRVLSPSAWWRLMRIGPQSAIGAPDSSRT